VENRKGRIYLERDDLHFLNLRKGEGVKSLTRSLALATVGILIALGLWTPLNVSACNGRKC
jgi:hypothetical protein